MTQAPVGFDLDMTLIDSSRAILASFAGVAADTGVAIDPAGVTSRLGIKLEAELAYWFPPGEVDAAVRALPRALPAARRAADHPAARRGRRPSRRSGRPAPGPW